MSAQPNLILSYGVQQDHELADAGHQFLGAALGANDSEVHVFLRKGGGLLRNGFGRAGIAC